MNYRHGFHAGNFADVVKHLALVAALEHLKRKPAPFAVIDSHAGCGVYDLTGPDAVRTGEAAGGLLRLDGLTGGPPALTAYLKLAADKAAYPGSPLIAARLKRPEDRLAAIEKHPEEFARLADCLRPYRKARAVEADGYERLVALMPPPERRGLILIDPPFEEADEFAACAHAFANAFRRFATGIYMLWFPVKAAAEANRFCGEILAAGGKRAVRLDTALNAPAEGRLGCAGLVTVNPPYGFEAEMRASLELVLPRLDAAASFAWLAGGE
jgi:23S rRNA (adenine2030-N6)-methyltransferase